MGLIFDRARQLRRQAAEAKVRQREQAVAAAGVRQREVQMKEAESAQRRAEEQRSAASKIDPIVRISGARELMADMSRTWGCGKITEDAHEMWGGGEYTTISLSHSFIAGRYKDRGSENMASLEGARTRDVSTSIKIRVTPDGIVELQVQSDGYDPFDGSRDPEPTKRFYFLDHTGMRSFLLDALATDLSKRQERGQMPRAVEKSVQASLRKYLKEQSYVTPETRRAIRRALRGGG